MLETIATAVANPGIDKETTAKLRAALLARISGVESDPAYVADRAVAGRLFGTFPYGRPVLGTTASLQKIEYADLLDARQRFLTADNATVAISGNFDRALALKALRRYFGGWLKSDRKVPSTFRQPEEPLAAILEVPSPTAAAAEVRYAFRGVSRDDKDLAASLVFTQIIETRLKNRLPSGQFSNVFVRNEPHTLPGVIVVGYSTSARTDVKKEDLYGPIRKSLSDPISDAEITAARSAVLSSSSVSDPVTLWLDADTYQIANIAADTAGPGVSFADVRAYAEHVQKLTAVAVVVNSAAKTN
jgi:zinc protease